MKRKAIDAAKDYFNSDPEHQRDFHYLLLHPEELPREEPKPRYIIRTAADALKPQPPIEYVVKPLFVSHSVNIVYGKPGKGKTYSMMSMGTCTAQGKRWLNYETTKTNVLIIDEESGGVRLSRRLGEALRGENCDETTPIFYISLAHFKLDDDLDPILIENIIDETQAGLVIIDALSEIMDGDENSKKDVQPIFNKLRTIADNTGAAIVVIHHSNKQGSYRGSSAIEGNIETMIQVEYQEKSKQITFTSEKNRDGKLIEFAAIPHWEDDKFYLTPAMVQKQEFFSKAERYVMGYLKENGASPIPDIMAAADICSPQSARQAVYSLTSRNLLYRVDKKEKGSVATYGLASFDNDD